MCILFETAFSINSLFLKTKCTIMQTQQFLGLKTLFFLLLSFVFQKAMTQTLVAGDIAFTGYKGFGASATVDEFSFVLLKTITNGTVINFTDRGWLRTGPSTGAFSNLEVTGITWTSNAAYVVGTEIKIVGLTATYAYLSGGSPVTGGSAGTVTGTALSLSANGDQVIAYQGTIASPSFISAIHMNVYTSSIMGEPTTTDAIWEGNYDTANSSGIPSGLTTGVNAIWIGTQGDINSEKDNARFVCAGNLTTVANIKALIYDKTKWTTSDGDPGGPIFLPTNCNYLGINPVLPLNLISFSATGRTNHVEIKWQSENEKNFRYYDIERSNTGKTFSTIATIKPQAYTSNYTYFDNEAKGNTIYYRLKMVDLDGETVYSNIISIQQKGVSKVKIYPTVTNGELRIEGSDNFVITNTNGQTVFTQSSNKERTINIAHLANGIYLVKGLDNEGFNFLEKIMIFN
jgi:Secretion system C-terminal sorting domain